jgi:hypothetical protein
MSSDRTYEQYQRFLAARREPAMAAAREMLDRGEYRQAIAAVRAADPSIEAQVAMARLLEAHLVQLIGQSPQPEKSRLEQAFRHTLEMYDGAYPDPHTQIEADDFARGRAEDRARLVKILGHEPGR